ncbi:MAG: InlB B-repeat-containing protein [Acetatifactor sp.]|nr:InlB B-repeat-containing protein [Acetatifactor sp.]
MQRKQKRFRRSLLAMFVMLAAVVAMTFSSTSYAAVKVTVKFSANGGSVSTSSKQVNYPGTYGTLPTPSRRGYSFAGWYTSASGGTKITSTTKVIRGTVHALYAHWTANRYTVTFNGMGTAVSPSSKTVTYDSSYGTLPSPSKTGYTFSGWYTNANGKGTRIYSGTTVKTASNHTLYAYWVPINRTLYFNANGGSVSPTYKTVTYGKSLGSLPTPTRSGYTFAGWSKTQTGSANYVNSNTTFNQTSNLTVYARWNKNVSFVTNGGTAVSSRNYLIGTAYGTLPSTSKSGYLFLGWYRGQNSGVRVYPSESVSTLGTLYAKWEPITGTFKARDCHNSDGSFHSAASHKRAFTANDAKVQGLRSVVRGMADSKQKFAALYALDAVGSYYCQEQRKTNGAYDCSSLVGRSYTFAGVTATFSDLPVTGTMKSRLDALVSQGKAIKVTNGSYQTGDIMFNYNSYSHVSIYIGTYGGVKYRVAAEGHSDGVGYFDVTKRSYTAVYRLK